MLRQTLRAGMGVGVGLLIVLSACGSRSAPAAGSFDSGVTGVSVLANACPVTPQTEDCGDQPMPAHLTVTPANSTDVVATRDTDVDGKFRIELTPGTYTMTPTNMSAAPMPSAYPVTFEVHQGEFTTITVRFDSGVR